MDQKKQTEEKLRKLLERLRNELAAQKNISNIQRIILELRIYQVEQEIRNLEFSDTQRQLTEARDRYAELYEFAPIAYVTFDNQAHITDLNHAAAKLFGQARDTIINKPISHWLSDEDSPVFLQHLYQVSFSKKKVSTDLTIYRPEREPLVARLESIAIRDQDGVATRCQTAILDITERTRIEDVLRSSRNELEARVEERTRQLAETNKALLEEIEQHADANEKLKQAAIVFDNTEDGILIMDANFNIINVNRSFSLMIGYDIDELIGKNPRVLVVNRTDEKYYQYMVEALHEHNHWKGEIWYQNKQGKHIPVWKNINSVTDENNQVSHYVAIVTDITPLKETEKRLEHLAHHDPLTGLPNRLHFIANLEQALKRALRRKRRLALLLLDLDNFKDINDSMGHATGDTLLKIVAERLQDTVRHEDTVARLGGDEFTVILEDITHYEDAGYIADKIINAVSQPALLDDREVTAYTSIGIAVFPDDTDDPDELTKFADTAMYRAKEEGGRSYEFYAHELTKRAADNLALENELRHALRAAQFEVYYQPQITLNSDQVVGMEALIRWNHPERGLLTPDQFMPVAEESGLINDIDEWVLNTACTQVNRWQKASNTRMRVSINLAEHTLTQGRSVIETVRNALTRSGLDPTCLEIDIPEHLLQGGVRNINKLHALKRLGVRLSIGDYGRGLSSLATLKELPIDTIKIDRSFINAIPGNPRDVALASAIIAMGHNMKLKVSASGVMSGEQLDFLKSQGCDELQGYYFSEPMPFETARNYFASKTLH